MMVMVGRTVSRAHPRECGADGRNDYRLREQLGSSPRVRGRPTDKVTVLEKNRLIPASAGQTGGASQSKHSSQAHPRECGADLTTRHGHGCCWGSSPRVRGRPMRIAHHHCPAGLIPASAGQTTPASRSTQRRRAHPRECGADEAGIPQINTNWGSSPRVRGRQNTWRCRPRDPGLIPASAGQTTGQCRLGGIGGAHPRECGADSFLRLQPVSYAGSSPRVRGRPGRPVQAFAVSGLIPASAGQTTRTSRSDVINWAHPRECGADCSTVELAGHIQGSSPRVRGRPDIRVPTSLRAGLIPASAGQTCRR